MCNLTLYCDSNLLYEEGGHKTHIYDWDNDRLLCGNPFIIGSSTLTEVDLQWLDNNKGINLCSKCESIARKLLITKPT